MRQTPWAYPIAILALLAVAASAGSLPPVTPGARDRCPVCGMFVAKYPDWVAQVRFKDQQTVFFDGAKDCFKYYFKMASFHPGRSPADVAAIYVTDYYTVRFLDAAAAFFVVGSEVYGPMGHELIAFASAADAEGFMRDHRGRQVLRFEALTPELVKGLD
jgi:nitrous oxide reductase accessory protein NosL